MDLIKTIEESQRRTDLDSFKIGDTVRVHFKIVEGKTERIQVYEGLVICFKNAGVRRTFTFTNISKASSVNFTSVLSLSAA